jgi:hypothetical protein
MKSGDRVGIKMKYKGSWKKGLTAILVGNPYHS